MVEIRQHFVVLRGEDGVERGGGLVGVVAGSLLGVVSSPYMSAATKLGFRGSSFANWLWAL